MVEEKPFPKPLLPMSGGDLWWTAEMVENAACLMCWREYVDPPLGQTAEQYWKGVAPRIQNFWRRMAATAFSTVQLAPLIRDVLAVMDMSEEIIAEVKNLEKTLTKRAT